MRKLFAWVLLTFVSLVSFWSVWAWLVDDSQVNNTQVQVQEVKNTNDNLFNKLLWIEQTDAYNFSSASWITIEEADVNDVTDSALIWIASFFQILKFVWLAILIWVSVFIVNKIFSIAKVG